MRSIVGVTIAMLLALLVTPLASQNVRADDGVTLDNDSLRSTLTAMGLAPSPLKSGYLLNMKSGTFTVYVQVVLSSDASRIGLNANLGNLDEAAVTADQWKAVMAANADYDPFYFYYDAKLKRLLFHFSMDNRGITPAILRHYLDEFSDDVRSSADTWNFVK